MVDLTQPSSVAEFVSAGASPEQAAILVEQHEAMAGRRGADARAAYSIAARDEPPPPRPGPAASTVTQAEATASLEAHTQAQLSAHLDKAYAAPASPSDYQFPPTQGEPTDADMAGDNELKAALHAEGWPAWLGNGIPKALSEGERELSRMTPEQVQARTVSTQDSLKRMWGKEYESNLATVDTYLEQMAQRHPGLGIDGSVRLDNGRDVPLLQLLDSFSVNSLLEFARHRASRRA